MNRLEMIDAITRERVHLLDLVDQLGPDADRRPVTEDGWTAKDVLAHLIHWCGQVAGGLGAKLDVPPCVSAVGDRRLEGDDAWNAVVVDYHRGKPLAEVRHEFDRNVDLLLQQLRSREDLDPEARANDVLGWGPTDKAIWRVIAGETFMHWPAHAKDLERALTWST